MERSEIQNNNSKSFSLISSFFGGAYKFYLIDMTMNDSHNNGNARTYPQSERRQFF